MVHQWSTHSRATAERRRRPAGANGGQEGTNGKHGCRAATPVLRMGRQCGSYGPTVTLTALEATGWNG